MNKWIKRSGAALGVVVIGAGVAFAAMVGLGQRKLERRVDVPVMPVPFASDAASVERGRYLFLSRGCADCHGKDAGGQVVIADGGLYIRSPNITSSPQSATAAYTPADWVRSIRHGVNPEGRALMIMPSEEYTGFVDADLAAVVAYIRQLPPSGGPKAEIRLPLLLKALYGADQLRDASQKIDHSLAPAKPVAEGVTAAHGAYVAQGCVGCHGPKLGGGKIPGAPPSWPPAAKLSPGAGSALDRYTTAEQFMAMFRTGKRPDGSSVSEVMPFSSFKEWSEVDIRALYLHLRALPGGG
jgi:mono/diheme cytochrome c family protein